MKPSRFVLFVTFAIVGLEAYALHKGIDGLALTVSTTTLAGIAGFHIPRQKKDGGEHVQGS